MRSRSYCKELQNAPVITDLFNKSPVFPIAESLIGTGNVLPAGSAQIALRFPGPLFTDPNPPHKDEALGAFDRTVAMVVATIRKQSEGDWGKRYTAEREPEAKNRFQIFVRCAGHAYHHVGQIIYLSRELART